MASFDQKNHSVPRNTLKIAREVFTCRVLAWEQGIPEISTLMRQSQGGAYFSNTLLGGQSPASFFGSHVIPSGYLTGTHWKSKENLKKKVVGHFHTTMIHKAFWKIEHPPYNGAESIPENRKPSIQWNKEHSIFRNALLSDSAL